MRIPPTHDRRGLTLVEMMISLVLLSILVFQLTRVFDSARRQGRLGTALMELETQTVRTMEKVVEGLRGADFGSLLPGAETPASSSWIEFETAEGFDGTAPTWSGVQRIELIAGQGSVKWTTDLGGPDERSFFLVDGVPDFLEGEDLDGTDQNDNDLVDESGLCFSVEDDTLVVRLTLTQGAFEGQELVRTVEARIVPRN